MAAARDPEASGGAAAMATVARELATSGATVVMAIADGDGSWLEAARTSYLGVAAARATAVGGSERGQSVSARAVAWGDLVF